jgi:hypothetical protein
VAQRSYAITPRRVRWAEHVKAHGTYDKYIHNYYIIKIYLKNTVEIYGFILLWPEVSCEIL